MGVIGVDGGNTKTELLHVAADGEVLAYRRGPGSNSHGPGGAEGSVAVLARLVEGLDTPVEHAAYFLCGADVPADFDALERALAPRGWARRSTVENDTFALLRTGSDAPDAVAIVCGAGINCVGRNARGDTARYPALGPETGDWGGSEMLGREALFLAARAEDGRGEPTALVELVRTHFGLPTVAAVGEELHYRRLSFQRLGELAPAVVAAVGAGDAVARGLVERLAQEIALLAARALRDLELEEADVVLGGGMLRPGSGPLHDEVVARLPAGARPVVAADPPALGAALAALDAVGAGADAGERLRERFRAGLSPEAVA
jgi:N-acetylglucosamine kinase-like BadF-type ATPase